MLEVGLDFSAKFSFAERLPGTYSCPYGGVYSFIYYVMMYVCVCVLFVFYMKGSFSFDPNNDKFTRRVGDCMEREINFI